MSNDVKKHLSPAEAAMKAINDMSAASQASKLLASRLPKVPDFSFPRITEPAFVMPRIPSAEERNQYQSASVLMRAIADEALQWKARLPENYRPAILAIAYGGIQINVQTLSQVSFHGIRIEGTFNGSPCSILAHQSTVQLMCYGEEVDVSSQHNPIGFIWDANKIEV